MGLGVDFWFLTLAIVLWPTWSSPVAGCEWFRDFDTAPMKRPYKPREGYQARAEQFNTLLAPSTLFHIRRRSRVSYFSAWTSAEFY